MKKLLSLLLVLCVAALPALSLAETQTEIIVFAAASMTETLTEIKALYEAAHPGIVTLFADGVDLIKEYDRASGLARRLKQRTHTAGAHAYIHFYKIRTVYGKKWNACFSCQCAGHKRFACAGRTVKQHAARYARAKTIVGFRRTDKMQHVAQTFHGFIIGRHV